jgi:hypothetical protein
MRTISARAVASTILAALASAAAAQQAAPLRNHVATRAASLEACATRLADAERAARLRADSEVARTDIRWNFTKTADKGPYRAFSAARTVSTRTSDTRLDAVYVYEYSCVGPVFHEVSDVWVQERPRAEPFNF